MSTVEPDEREPVRAAVQAVVDRWRAAKEIEHA